MALFWKAGNKRGFFFNAATPQLTLIYFVLSWGGIGEVKLSFNCQNFQADKSNLR